jgi:DNA-binding CsgD family transcriptional regulator
VVSGGDAGAVPASVRDAVLARRARLEAPARAVLDLVSVIPARAELSLIDAALSPDVADLEACVNAGLLCGEPHAVAFRHELARLAVADALPSPRIEDCHRRVLKALLARPDRDQVLARIVHHADACGDVDVLTECAPAAARQAAAVGAHCQAVAQYRRALRHAARLPLEARAELSEALAYEHYLTEDIDAARETCQTALDLYRRLGTTAAVGRSLRWLSRLAWFAGDGEEARRLANEAIAVLSDLSGDPELAMAFSTRSQLDMLSNDAASCIEWGTRAIELASRLDARDILSHALNNVGTARLCQIGQVAEGRAQLEESLRLALDGDLHEHAARAYTNLSSTAIEHRDYATASRWLEPATRYCCERDLESWTTYLLAWRGRLHAETGKWDAACEDARHVLKAPQVSTVSRIVALAALGLVEVRRGAREAQRTLDEALTLARRTAEPQRLVPVLLARAELAWLSGRAEDVKAAVDEGLEMLGQDRRPFERREYLWLWLWKVGAFDPAKATGDGPCVSLICGDWQDAAEQWQRLGCPYERALALAEGDVAAAEEALDIFHTLGAVPASDWARQRLRRMGQTRLPRGRRASTRSHPAGLTSREAEILGMLALGLRNPQIAERLFVTLKTIEHHVSSILAKLEVPTRDAAVLRARQQGWLADRRLSRRVEET